MLKRYGIAALAAVLAVLSCTHREESGIQKVKFQAVQADGPSTKTVLQADGSVFWSPGDAVSLFYGGATIQKTKLTAENTSAAAQTTFSGVLDGFLPDGSTSFWAVYPYAAETAFDGSAVTVTVPADQTAVAGTFASDAFVSIATSKDYTLQFYNLCGGIKFSVANQGITSVIFKGNSDEILAGQVQATFDENGKPVVTEVVKGTMELVLNAPEGGFEVGKWYYMVSLPTTLSAGYTMTFLDAAGGLVAERVTDTSIAIKRAVWGRLTEADNVGPEEGTVIYYTTSDGNTVDYYTHQRYPVDFSVVSNTYEDGKGVMTFDKPVTSISYHAFSGKSTLTSITLPETVTSIDEEAFSSCTSLAWPDIPESVTQIGPGAFYGCDAFVSVIIPDSVLEFGSGIFQACSNLESITCQFASSDGKCLVIDGVLNSVASVGLPNEYTFPDDVTVVGHSALRNSSYSGRLIFSENLLSIEKEAFAYAYSIKSIELGESLESVSDGAFILCGADSLILPASLATIGKEAFAASFDYLKFLSTTPPEASGLIFETQYISDFDFPVYVPAESVNAYKTVEYWSAYADRIHPIGGESTITASKYLTFTSTGTTTVSLTNEEGNAPVLYYSTDAQNWTQWDYSGLTFTEAAPLYICGDNPDGFSSGSSIFSTFSATGDFFSISGDIMSLVNKDEDLTTVWSYWFYKLFSGCSLLKEGPSLPASKVSNRSYYGLFENCTNLLVAPELPATILGESCYSGMFAGCTSLTTAPALPATSLAGSCYSTMFRGCSNLTVAPVLPATIAVQNCYSWMFSDCSSLINAPELPATTLEHDCYNHMFSGCTSLSAAPNLPAVELESACYFYMFDGCTNMSVAPELLSSTLVSNCYLGMFYNCSKIDYIKCLATDISANGCLSSWVKGVSSTGTFVKSADVQWPTGESGIPTGWEIEVEQSITASKYLTFTSTGTTTVSLTNEEGNAPVLYYSTDAQNWTQWDYSGLTFTGAAPLYICGDNPDGFSFSLNPDKISTFTAAGDPFSVSGDIMSLVKLDGERTDIPYPGCFKNLFRGCTLLISAPSLTATTLTGGCYTSMFSGCTGLTVAPELPATTLQTYCYAQMFEGCTSLTVAPELSATSLDHGCYSGMFWGCEGLTTAPALPATTLAEYCYENMFYGCTNLTEAPELPATTLATQCYQVMFADCTSLSAAPELPATNLASGCYNMMFSGCTKLEEAPELPATTLASNCYWDMFSNCTSLTSAPTLPAATLPSGAYGQMFHGCSNLSFVTCLATDISASDCLYNWLYGVADNGTFVKAANMTDWSRSTSGIPESWNVQDASSSDFDGRWEGLRDNDDPSSTAFVALFEGDNLDLYIIAWGQHLSGTYSYEDGTITYDITAGLQAYTDVTYDPQSGEMLSHSWQAGNLDPTTLTLRDGYDWYSMSDEDLSNLQDFAQFPFVIQDNGTAISSLVGIQDLVFSKVN